MLGMVDTLWWAVYVVGFRDVTISHFWITHSVRAYPGDAAFLGAWHRATYHG
jgi:hypothetical protein